MKKIVKVTESKLRQMVTEAVMRVINENITANNIYQNVIESLFDLRQLGETEIIYGDDIEDKFRVYTYGHEHIDTLEVEWQGKSKMVNITEDIFDNDNLLTRIIMKVFAQLYMNKNV